MCCSSNGSIREWSLAHEMKNTRFLAQMWEHNGYVTDLVRAVSLCLITSCVHRVGRFLATALP